MCRIVGIYDKTSVHLKNEILKMRDSMHRGGPDGAGFYIDLKNNLALGHRRLALLDLSTAGIQPMHSSLGNVQIVFNGEIYNFLELRNTLEKEGFCFTTKTDTEVILNSYYFWGVNCFEQFNGMFAIAIWDSTKQKVLLGRDHAGIKPLYYYTSNEKFYFASEVRAFKALNPDWIENPHWKIPFLAYGHLPEPFTTLLGVKSLQKGCYAEVYIPDLEVRLFPYQKYTYSNSITHKELAINSIKEKLHKAVRRQLISDAPLGVFLSGGIDSSILTILAAKETRTRLKTLSIVFEEQDFSEEVYQKMVVDQTNVEHHSFTVTNQMFRDEFPKIMEAMDQPSIDGINTYFICKFAKEYGLTAVFSGLGADELLGGYDSIKRSQLLKKLSILPSFLLSLANYSPNDKLKRIAYITNKNLQGKYLFYRGIYSHGQISKILDVPVSLVGSVLSSVNTIDCNSKSEKQQAAHIEMHLYMQNQLLKDTDYMSMWHGLEVRVPFLDKEMIELCNSIDPKLKFDLSFPPKFLLIEAFKDILPNAVWNRRKQGFTFPLTKWISHIVPVSRSDKFEKTFKKLNKSAIHWSKYWTYILATSINVDLIFLKKGYERTCFYNLDAFASMGGIEKFNRSFLYALSGLEKECLLMADAASMYDCKAEKDYFNNVNYRHYNKNKFKFVLQELAKSRRYKTIILGHINLALFGLLIKTLNPKIKILIVVHGIEVWDVLKGFKRKILEECNIILAVSNYTKNRLVEVNAISENKIKIFHNTLDPFFKIPNTFKKPNYLLHRYNIHQEDKILFTLTRLAYTEKYKGYDKVIEVLPRIIHKFPNVKYFIGGKPDAKEKIRLQDIICNHKLENNVFLIGYVEEEEVTDHYQMADIFIMPSKKEGFGIVFIEAMSCGLTVIAGNQDGSVDALKNGELGILLNPENDEEMIEGLSTVLGSSAHTLTQKKDLQQKVTSYFGFPNFYNNLKKQLVN